MVVGRLTEQRDVVIIGAGPGGYVAALRAAGLGKEVLLIDDREKFGGVCLIEGCIPSKTLITAKESIETAERAAAFGMEFKNTGIDLEKLRNHKDTVVKKLSKGIEHLLSNRNVEILKGRARFKDEDTIAVESEEGVKEIEFEHCILATGSTPVMPKDWEGKNLWTSKTALDMPKIPEKLAVVGAGYIGLELGTVYSTLGSEVTVIEMLDEFLPAFDEDIKNPLFRSLEKEFESIKLNTKVEKIKREDDGYRLEINKSERDGSPIKADKVLVAAGRKPNTSDIGLDNTGIQKDENGKIKIDETCQSSQASIYAIGDITPGPMLAHKASRQGKVVAEVIAGERSAFDNRVIPSVIYTDPELAWTGKSVREAEENNIETDVGTFPHRALGRALSAGKTEGFTKIVARKESGLIIGGGITGPNASEMISEVALAIEMGATLEDLMVTIHPHPSFAESVMEAAELADDSTVHVPGDK